LAACTFDLRFCYVRAGWEGAAHDARVLQDAQSRDFAIPEKKYYLGDAGYGLSSSILTPYRGVRYHLQEYKRSNQGYVATIYDGSLEHADLLCRPQNPKELFNLRHSSLRNAIERIFGVLKRRFPILTTRPEYPFPVQAKIVIALCILHNFIKVTGGEDTFFEHDEDQRENDAGDEEVIGVLGRTEGTADRAAAAAMRDAIAEQMWADYQSHLRNGRARNTQVSGSVA
jgi:hypothetical protein